MLISLLSLYFLLGYPIYFFVWEGIPICLEIFLLNYRFYIYISYISLSLSRPLIPSSLTIILFPLIGAQAWAPHSPNILLFSSATLPIVRHPLPHSHRGATTHSIPPSRLLLLLVHCLYTSQIETLTHESGDDSTDQHKLQFKSLHESSTFWSWDRLSFHFSLARRLLYRVEGP